MNYNHNIKTIIFKLCAQDPLTIISLMPIREITFLISSGGQGEPPMMPTAQKQTEEHIICEINTTTGGAISLQKYSQNRMH